MNTYDLKVGDVLVNISRTQSPSWYEALIVITGTPNYNSGTWWSDWVSKTGVRINYMAVIKQRHHTGIRRATELEILQAKLQGRL